METRLEKELSDVRKNGDLCWLRPEQSADTAGGVHVGKEVFDVGTGDQGIIFAFKKKTPVFRSSGWTICSRSRRTWRMWKGQKVFVNAEEFHVDTGVVSYGICKIMVMCVPDGGAGHCDARGLCG